VDTQVFPIVWVGFEGHEKAETVEVAKVMAAMVRNWIFMVVRLV
jgi:hypothetical protein